MGVHFHTNPKYCLFSWLLPLLLTPLLHAEPWSIDRQLTLSLQGNNSHPVIDYSMECIALGTPVIEIGWILYQFWYHQSTYDLVSTRFVAKAYVVNAIITGMLKYTIRRKRPRRDYQPRLWNTRITPSFPSGHVAASTAFATIVSVRYPERVLPLTVFAVTSAYSQVYVGNHYVSDVLGGMAIGFLIAKLILISEERTSTSTYSQSVNSKPLLNLTVQIPL